MPCCYDPHLLNDMFIFLDSVNYLNPNRGFTIFSTDCVNYVKNFKYMYSGLLCGVCHLINVSSWHFLWFLICGLVQILFLSLVVIFNASISIFLLLL